MGQREEDKIRIPVDAEKCRANGVDPEKFVRSIKEAGMNPTEDGDKESIEVR